MNPSCRQHPRRFRAPPRPGASSIPSASAATNMANSPASAANVVTEHTTHVAAAGPKYPPGLIAHAQALLSKPRKAPTRRYVSASPIFLISLSLLGILCVGATTWATLLLCTFSVRLGSAYGSDMAGRAICIPSHWMQRAAGHSLRDRPVRLIQ
jgi:hypothetical protein